MLMLRITNYIHGIVRIRIQGAVPEKFINLCLARGIFLWGITKRDDELLACLRLPDFFRIREVTRRSATRVRVAGFSGLPFVVRRIKRRKMMVAGAILFFLILRTLASYVWFVDITGVKTLPGERVREIAGREGLRPGAPKDGVDIKAVERELMLGLPEAAWVGINMTGTRAVIEIVEKTPPREEDKSPADIVAVKDGVISELIVIAGQAAVKKGDTVKKGDLLVKGLITETPPPGDREAPELSVPARPVRAGGIIKAQVWYESYGEAGLVRTVARRTGNQLIGVTLEIGGNVITLKKAPDQPFAHYETEVTHKKLPVWRNSELTVESTISVFHELLHETEEITPEQARDLARAQALRRVQDIIPEGAQVLARNVEILKTAEPGLVRAKVTVETIEDIGQTKNISQ